MKFFILISILIISSTFCDIHDKNHFEGARAHNTNFLEEQKQKAKEILESLQDQNKVGGMFNELKETDYAKNWEKFISQQSESSKQWLEHEGRPAVEAFYQAQKEKNESLGYDQVRDEVEAFAESQKKNKAVIDAYNQFLNNKVELDSFVKAQDNAVDFIEKEAIPAIDSFVHTHKDQAKDFFDKAQPALDDFIHKNREKVSNLYKRQAKPAVDEFIQKHQGVKDFYEESIPKIQEFAHNKEMAEKVKEFVHNKEMAEKVKEFVHNKEMAEKVKEFVHNKEKTAELYNEINSVIGEFIQNPQDKAVEFLNEHKQSADEWFKQQHAVAEEHLNLKDIENIKHEIEGLYKLG
jgi:hypothetical protein